MDVGSSVGVELKINIQFTLCMLDRSKCKNTGIKTEIQTEKLFQITCVSEHAYGSKLQVNPILYAPHGVMCGQNTSTASHICY